MNNRNFNKALQQAKKKTESYVSLFIGASVLVLIFSLTFFDGTKTATGASSSSTSERPVDYERCATTVDRQAEQIRSQTLKVEDACQSLEEEGCPAMNCEYLKGIAATELNTNQTNSDSELYNCVHGDGEIYRGIKWRCNSAGQAQDVPQLEASDRHGRMKEMLAYYGVDELYDTFIVGARAYGIYPELAICIAKADTTLGMHMKTHGNIGNVGNVDSGATRSFRNNHLGVLAIYQTLNNQYLGNYSTIDMLSRKHNKEGYVYATSEENHFNNVANCISVIRGENIPDNWNYRF